jgi:Ca-activated chloride channel family protein
MADPTDPKAAPDSPRPSALRRPLLTITGLSLLSLGAFVNADRLGLERSEQVLVKLDLADESIEEEPPPEELALEDEVGGYGQRHKGEEGKMGKPSSKSKSGIYAMKGPKNAVPQMARDFDPDTAARNAGILGVMQQEGSGQYLASPYGGAFAVGNDGGDVWGGLTGTEVGDAYGTGGLGIVGTGRGGGGVGAGLIGTGHGQGYGSGELERNASGERYAEVAPNVFIPTSQDAKSTFSIDVDTAAYANTRRFLLESGQLPPANSVRTEELINYFDYEYSVPAGDGAPFSITTEVGPSPWAKGKRLVHIGIQGEVPEFGETPPRNLVFLIDVSGSMGGPDCLPLVKHGLASLTEQLGAKDRVSIVVYAGAAGAVLPPTRGDDRQAILAALDRLDSGGSTNGAEGIELAYQLAEKHFIKGGINRVLLATDGDFNVGISDHDALIRLIEKKRKSGVFLSVLGVGQGNLNDHMMEQVADKGNGNYAYIDGMLEARKVLVEEAGSTLHTIAKDVKIQVEFDPDLVAEHRLVGYENRVLAHRDFDDDSKDAGEIGAGHSVTAIYEIVPTADSDSDSDPLLTLNMRYKQPDGHQSRKLSAPVQDRGRAMSETSDDYRFAAAVAAFGETLRGTQDDMRYAEILELAEGSLGEDPKCYRHQFLELVWKAGTLAGEQIAEPDHACATGEARPPRIVESVDEETEEVVEVVPEVEPSTESEPVVHTDITVHEHHASTDWMAFVTEVLRLLPPLLALPMFVMAWRRPRRR